MKKIKFQDYPSTETPLNAENLNSMQDNIENAILKFMEITVVCEQNSVENVIDYSSVQGTIICSFLIGGQNTVGNGGQTSIVPTYMEVESRLNKVHAINYFSNDGKGVVHIGVFYTN